MLLKGKGLKVNIHTHSSSERGSCVEIINLMPHDLPEKLDKLKRYSIGIHPWDIVENSYQYLAVVEEYLQYPNVIALGEVGLDKICGTDFKQQQEFFQDQLDIAERFGKPVILHTVKSYSETLSFRKKNSSGTWIMHGFNANEYIAGEFLKTDTYLSFGHLLSDPRSKSARLFDLFPRHRIFLETDDNTDFTIYEIYTEAARKLKLDVHTLDQQIIRNFNTVFRDI